MNDFNDPVLDEQMALSPMLAAMIAAATLPFNDHFQQPSSQAHHETREAFATGLLRNRLVLQGLLSSPVIFIILTSLDSFTDPAVVEIMYEGAHEAKHSLAAVLWGELTHDAQRSLLSECATLARHLEIVQDQSDSASPTAYPPHDPASDLDEQTRCYSIPHSLTGVDARNESASNPFCGPIGLATNTPFFVQDKFDAAVVFLELTVSSLGCTGFRVAWSPKLTSLYPGKALPDATRRLESYGFRKPTIYVLFKREKGQVIGVHMTPRPPCHSEAARAVQTIFEASIVNGAWRQAERQEEVES